MNMEPEVVIANMRQMGCPHEPLTAEAGAWMNGYVAGVEAMRKCIKESVRDALAEQGL